MQSMLFRAALFTEAKTWQPPKCPSTEEWTEKMQCTHAMEYHSVMERNETMPFAATWMQLEIIILSKVSQKKTNTILYLLYVEYKI